MNISLSNSSFRLLACLAIIAAAGCGNEAQTEKPEPIAQEQSGASDGYLALAHAPACAHRMHFRATRGVNLRTLAVRRFARCHG